MMTSPENFMDTRKDELQKDLKTIGEEKQKLHQRLNILNIDEQRIAGALALINEFDGAQKGKDNDPEDAEVVE